MKQQKLAFIFSILLVFVSGCINEGGVFKSSAEEKVAFSSGILSASMEIIPKNVNSGEKVNVFLYLTNPSERELKNVVVCIYGYGINENCKKVSVYEEEEVSFSFHAPKLPKGIEKTEYVYARVIFKDSFIATANFPVIDEKEYSIRLRTGKQIPEFSLTSSLSPISVDVELDETPIISSQGYAEFEFTINLHNRGNGKVFNPEEFSLTMPSLSDEDYGIAYLEIITPEGLEISCERESKSGRYVIEFFDNEDSIFCNAIVNDKSISLEKILPVTFKIEYGYYFDIKESYIVKGKGGIEKGEYSGEYPQLPFENIKINFKNCGEASWNTIEILPLNYEIIGIKINNKDEVIKQVKIHKTGVGGGISISYLSPSEKNDACYLASIFASPHEEIIKLSDTFCGTDKKISSASGTVVYAYQDGKYCYFKDNIACNNIESEIESEGCESPEDEEIIKKVISPYYPGDCFQETNGKYSKWYVKYEAIEIGNKNGEYCYKIKFTSPENAVYYEPYECKEINEILKNDYDYFLILEIHEGIKEINIEIIC